MFLDKLTMCILGVAENKIASLKERDLKSFSLRAYWRYAQSKALVV